VRASPGSSCATQPAVAFDLWVTRTHPAVPFERYADDAIRHCRTQSEAEALRAALAERFATCGLALHPQKTKIVYCADSNRNERYPTVQFDFLGYTFRPRFTAWPNGTYGVSFLPAASREALKAMRREVRQWGLQNRTDTALDDLARRVNPYIRGWINYYSHFYKSALYDSLRRIDFHLRKWVRRKFKRFKQKPRGAREWLARIITTNPALFAHWPLLYAQQQGTGSRMN
jgi:RNA-directed DNA polymerase